jgi:hypothetical protein
MLVQKRWDQEDEEKKEQQQILPKLSTIFKEKLVDIPQLFGSFVSDDGKKYCAVSALLKYLGHDISRTTTTATKEVQNDKKGANIELIPSNILEIAENFIPCSSNVRKYSVKCFCLKPAYYYCYSLVSLLIHLNDYHNMTFIEIGNWLETKGM